MIQKGADSMPARHHVANAIDWYVNKLNEIHLLPVNLATLVRDISAKQIGGEGFQPRPLTAANFTDPELDAINSLASKAVNGKSVKYRTYNRDLGMHMTIGKKSLDRYLSPLNTIRTTLGQFAVQPSESGGSIRDTYDFNREEGWKVLDHGDGTFSYKRRDNGRIVRVPKDEIEKILSRADDGAYGIIRQNAANFGHTDQDNDAEKIKVDIPLSDIRKRLGKNIGKYDLYKIPDKGEFAWRMAGAGALTGAPLGAAVGTISWLISLLNKKNRKKWARNLLYRTLGGAAIGSLIGGAGAGLLTNTAMNHFNSNPMNEKRSSHEDAPEDIDKKKDSGKFRQKVINALSYTIPVLALAGAGVYGASRLSQFRDRLLNPSQDIYTMKDKDIKFVNKRSEL